MRTFRQEPVRSVAVASRPIASGGFLAWAVPWWGGDALPVGGFFSSGWIVIFLGSGEGF